MWCSAGTLPAGIIVMYYLYNAFFQQKQEYSAAAERPQVADGGKNCFDSFPYWFCLNVILTTFQNADVSRGCVCPLHAYM